MVCLCSRGERVVRSGLFLGTPLCVSDGAQKGGRRYTRKRRKEGERVNVQAASQNTTHALPPKNKPQQPSEYPQSVLIGNEGRVSTGCGSTPRVCRRAEGRSTRRINEKERRKAKRKWGQGGVERCKRVSTLRDPLMLLRGTLWLKRWSLLLAADPTFQDFGYPFVSGARRRWVGWVCRKAQRDWRQTTPLLSARGNVLAVADILQGILFEYGFRSRSRLTGRRIWGPRRIDKVVQLRIAGDISSYCLVAGFGEYDHAATSWPDGLFPDANRHIVRRRERGGRTTLAVREQESREGGRPIVCRTGGSVVCRQRKPVLCRSERCNRHQPHAPPAVMESPCRSVALAGRQPQRMSGLIGFCGWSFSASAAGAGGIGPAGRLPTPMSGARHS